MIIFADSWLKKLIYGEAEGSNVDFLLEEEMWLVTPHNFTEVSPAF